MLLLPQLLLSLLPQLLPSLPQLLPSLPQTSESPDTPELPSEPDTVLLLLPQLAPSPLPHLLLDTDLPPLPQLSLDTDSGLLTNKQLIQNENTILRRILTKKAKSYNI